MQLSLDRWHQWNFHFCLNILKTKEKTKEKTKPLPTKGMIMLYICVVLDLVNYNNNN